MKISEVQHEQLKRALVGTFDRHELAGLAQVQCQINLPLGDEESAADYADRLISTASRSGRLTYLVNAALELRPSNAMLQQIVESALGALYEEKKTNQSSGISTGTQ